MNRLLAISDIHGCYNTFHELVVNRIKLDKYDKLVLLGDYIDRGPQSREVIDFIIDLKTRNFNVVPLAGNHESMLVDSFRNPEMLPLWLLNNGDTTLESLKIGSISEIDEKYVSFLSELAWFEEDGENIFVHAGFNDRAEDPFKDIHGMIWECRPAYSNPALQGKRIIHGHRPKSIDHVKKMIADKSPVIPIDTGCVYDEEDGYGSLSALDVSTMELISIKRIDS
jgi:serine/threonine protein phosphatase 1